MTSLILVAGIALVVAIAVAELRPAWRLPALAIALLAIPGNVDNLMPSMQLDYHALADNTAPAISVIDLLIAWAVILTMRERRRDRSGLFRPFLTVAAVLAGIGILAGAVAIARGVEPAAAVRGALLLLRLPALLFLAAGLIEETGDGTLLAVAVCLGAFGLLGNGVYTSVSHGQERFYATTFGWNNFGDVLVATSLVATGLALQFWPARRTSRTALALTALGVLIAALTVFGATATGTRMTLLVLVAGGATAGVMAAFWRSRARMVRAAVVVAAFVAVVSAAALTTPSGARALSFITDLAGVTTQSDEPVGPDQSEVRSRLEFWTLAARMTVEEPLTGVGAYQWNIERYDLSMTTDVVVADTHNAYLQAAAELGIPAMLALVLLLGMALWQIVVAPSVLAAQARPPGLPATGIGLAAAAVVLALGDLTNSNFFNVRTGAFEWLLIAAALGMAFRVTPAGWRPWRRAEGK
jgi:O-antigen ligase